MSHGLNKAAGYGCLLIAGIILLVAYFSVPR